MRDLVSLAKLFLFLAACAAFGNYVIVPLARIASARGW